jgi:hypothetical protein
MGFGPLQTLLSSETDLDTIMIYEQEYICPYVLHLLVLFEGNCFLVDGA